MENEMKTTANQTKNQRPSSRTERQSRRRPTDSTENTVHHRQNPGALRVKKPQPENNSGARDIFVFATVLMAIAAIVAGVLAYVNYSTKDIIAVHATEKRKTVLQTVFPEADSFVDAAEKLPEGYVYSDPDINTVYLAYKGTELVGYCTDVNAQGFSSTPMELMVGSDVLNKVTSVQVVSHRETPGLGEKVITSNAGFFLQFANQSRPIEFSNTITAVSGATYTSNGVLSGINDALTVVDTVRLQLAQTTQGGENNG